MKKIFKITIIVLILIMLIYILTTTYSKYVSNATAVIEEDIAKWNISINGTDITGTPGEAVEFPITDFTWDWEEDGPVKKPKVAPGMNGFFHLEIDPKNTDVAIHYSIKIDNTKLTDANAVNLKIQGIKLNGEDLEFEAVETADSGDGTTGATSEIEIDIIKTLDEVQSTDDTIRIDKLEVEVKWENDEAYNEQDSIIGSVPNNKITLPIIVEVQQYTGGTI